MSSNVPVMLPYPCPVSSALTAFQDDSTNPENDAVVRSQAAGIVQTSTDLWSLYLKEANERATVNVKLWSSSLKAFLLFAGLFAAVVSPFVIDSQAKLQPTPPATKVPISTLAINFLWFTSLTLTLISALAAVLAQTWIVKFSLVPAQGFKGAMERWIRDDGAENWHLHTAITWITAFIQLSLFLFLAGFAVQAMVDHRSLGWTILSFVLLTLSLYFGITVLPWLNPTTPFRTPISELSRRNQSILLSELLGLAPTTKAKSRSVWKSIQSICTNLRNTPDKADVRLGICWSILKNSSNNLCIHAAVLELTKQRIDRAQSQRLIELGLPEELSFRLAHPPAGLEKTVSVVQRMKSYLHVILWMVDECDLDVARGFSLLIKSDGALLLELDALPSACRALGFSIRVNLLVNKCEHGKIHGTDWTAMIDAVEPTFALDVFRTAFRGLVIAKDRVTEDFSQTRQDCARMLAAYIASGRFSNEGLAASRNTGDLIGIQRQEPSGHIMMFFSQLGGWSVSYPYTLSLNHETFRAILEEGYVYQNHSIAFRSTNYRFSSPIVFDWTWLVVLELHTVQFISQRNLETFRDAVNDISPDQGRNFKALNWKNAVDRLRRLSEILPQDSLGILPEAVTANFLQLVNLMPDQRGVLHDQMESDLHSSSWRIRVARLQSLAALIKTDTMSTAILAQAPSIMACLSFNIEDVRLAAIRTLQELSKHSLSRSISPDDTAGFQDVIRKRMSDILKLVEDGDPGVRAAAIDFVAELSGQSMVRVVQTERLTDFFAVPFHSAINASITSFISDALKSKDWFVRRDGLQVFGKIINSGQPYDGGIQTAFPDILSSLSDPNEDVREKALQVVSIAAGKVPLKEIISGAISSVLDAMNDSPLTQIAALGTLSALAKIGDLTEAIPKIVQLFEAEQEDVRVSALETCSEIAKIQPAALDKTINDTIAGILSALKTTRKAALNSASDFSALNNGLREKLNDNALDEIFASLKYSVNVRAQAVDTLAVFARKDRFRNKMRTAVRKILPLLEDWSAVVRRETLDTLVVFAQHVTPKYSEILAADDDISRIISSLSEGDPDTIARVLTIVSKVKKQAITLVNPPEISLVSNALIDENWRVRVAGLRLLESLAHGQSLDPQYKSFSFPAQETIAKCLADKIEEVQLAGLRTLFEFIDNGELRFYSGVQSLTSGPEIFHDRVIAPNNASEVISSLLQSGSEDIRISAIQTISTYVAKAELDSVIDGVLADLVGLLDPENQDTYVMILRTICSLADTGKFFGNGVFVGPFVVFFPHHYPPTAMWKSHVHVEILADGFSQIAAQSLKALLKLTLREENVTRNVDEVDDTFLIEVLKTLAELAKTETFRGKIDARLSKSYALTAKAGSWPTRVAFLKLMSVLGPSARAALKSAVKQMMPDINDTLHDIENSEVRMAGIQLLSISVVKEISSSEFNSLLPTLVTLLSDSEEEVRVTALETLSDLAKQDVFRAVINETLPALLESVKRNEPKARIEALETCASLAQDGGSLKERQVTFCDIVNRAAPQIIACLRDDPNNDVQIAAMVTLSQLSPDEISEGFRLIVSEAAPHIMSKLKNGAWRIRLQVLRTLSIFAGNDAFRDMTNSFFPKIVQCVEDEDDDVRVEVLKTLLNLIQQNYYRTSMREALQNLKLKDARALISYYLGHAKLLLAALPLLPKVIELGAFPDSAKNVMSTVVKLLSDGDEKLCIVVLETIRSLVEQDVAYAEQLTPEIPRLIQLLKPDHSNSGIPTTVLLTLSVMIAQDDESADKVAEGIRTMFSVFKDTRRSHFWDAATKPPVKSQYSGAQCLRPRDCFVVYYLRVAAHQQLERSAIGNIGSGINRTRSAAENRFTVSCLTTVSIENLGFQFDTFRPLVMKLVEFSDLDVRLAAIRLAGSSLNMMHDFPTFHKMQDATQTALDEVLAEIKSTSPNTALEQLAQFADDHVLGPFVIEDRVIDILSVIGAALKDQQYRDIISPFGDSWLKHHVANFRTRIQGEAAAIISVLKDRDSKIRVAGLGVLLKLVQEVRAGVLERLLPITLSGPESVPSWGHLRLIARLFKDERLQLEAADLRFLLCFLNTKNLQVQDFVLKFMIFTLQQYLDSFCGAETWREAEEFPTSLVSAFSSVALLKR
ncbi:armadillo-type protein [Mycena sanguinolenta]|nr:armadillo-type protein [Mycena sanguinolenta]